DALRRQSRLFLCGGRGAEAEAPIGKAVALLEKLPEGRELALAYSGLAMFYMNHDDAEGTIRSARRALELSERVGDTETLLHTLNSLGAMELLMGDPGGKAKLLRSLELAEEMGNDENVGRAYINLAGTMVRTRAYDDLMELVSAGIDFCLEHGLDLWRMWLISSQAQALLDQGDWSRAAELATTVLQGDGTQLPRVSALPVVALVRARRGDPDVWPLLDEARYRAEIEGDWSKAAELWSALGCEYDAALALAGADDDDLLRHSLVKLHSLGAEAAAAVVARSLRARGARGISRGPRSTTKRNPAHLT